MTTHATFAALRKSLATHSAAYAGGRSRQSTLQRYATPLDVLEALARKSLLDPLERNGVVVALVVEHRRGSSPVWQTLLLLAFEPMLVNLVPRQGRAHEDVSQRLFLAFLEALQRVPLNRFTALAIRTASVRVYADLRAAERGEDRSVPTVLPDDDKEGSEAAAPPRLEEGVEAAELLEELRGVADPELVEVLVETHAAERPLREYVEETYAHYTPKARASLYERLKATRRAVETKLRARRARHAA